jgi:lysophospholipase L1-like esterase
LEPSPARAQQGAPVLLALGDSYTAGNGATSPARDGYVTLMANSMRLAAPETTVTNLALPGETSATFSSGTNSQLERALAVLRSQRVDTVVMTLGGNDLLFLVASGQPCDLSRARRPPDLYPAASAPACRAAVETTLVRTRANIKAALASLQQAKQGPTTVLVGLYYNPFRLGLDPALDRITDEDTQRLNAAIRDAVSEIGSPDVRTFDLDTAFGRNVPALTHYRQRDVHPNNLGHRVIAAAVLRSMARPEIGHFSATPAGAAECPAQGQWQLLYWRGSSAAIAPVSVLCPLVDRYWVSRQGRWLAFAPGFPDASDPLVLNTGEAVFAHGMAVP